MRAINAQQQPSAAIGRDAFALAKSGTLFSTHVEP
jgi:hypothetical protein